MAELLILMEAKRRLKSVPDTVSGWAGAFSDPKIGRALAAIHADPSRNWTSALLAKEAAMSRTAFSERFRERIGEPPMTYVLRWRIQVAIDLLRAGTLPLAEVAQAAGYANESAFGKAFRREIGVSPAAYRRAAMEASRDSETLGAEQLRERAAESSAPKGDLGVELTQIVLEFERLAPPALCSVLLLNEHEQKLYVGAAPSLPEAYNRTIDGMGVGPQAGCCGAAVYLKRPLVTRDIPHSELWADYRYLAERFNLRSCWSSPILGDNGAVLGTFAVYYSDFHEPSGAELGLMDHMSRRVKSLLQACVRRSLGRADSERSDDTTERMEHRAG